ncbi:hypothetical protein SFC43_13840 [Bacteroides sp. CR5/BHMF/2]|nr:hypothetical protein [Bacteroides sp. CR5/BHMF/2]
MQGASLKQNTITVTLPAEVKTENEYSVLVVANLSKYITVAADLTAYLATFKDKTYGQAWEELQALLPVSGGATASRRTPAHERHHREARRRQRHERQPAACRRPYRR